MPNNRLIEFINRLKNLEEKMEQHLVESIDVHTSIKELQTNIVWVKWLVVGIAGGILSFVVDYTLVNMSTNIKDIGAISVGVQAMRDLVNIFFIFILKINYNIGEFNTSILVGSNKEKKLSSPFRLGACRLEALEDFFQEDQ